jgi:hypothetical protein
MKLKRKDLRKLINGVLSESFSNQGAQINDPFGGRQSSASAGFKSGGALNTLQSLIGDAKSLAKQAVDQTYQSPSDVHSGDPETYKAYVTKMDIAAERLAAFAGEIAKQSEIKTLKGDLIPIETASPNDAYDALFAQINEYTRAYESNKHLSLGDVAELVTLHKKNKGFFIV